MNTLDIHHSDGAGKVVWLHGIYFFFFYIKSLSIWNWEEQHLWLGGLEIATDDYNKVVTILQL